MKFQDIKTLRHLFRYRPLAVEAVEKAVGAKCWHHLDDSLPVFCEYFGLLPSALLDRVAGLDPVPADMDWDVNPLYCLIDFLTANHRNFREKSLPGLRESLDVHGIPTFPDRYVVELILQDFQEFERGFLAHMAEEEEIMFPEILHVEAMLRHRIPTGKELAEVDPVKFLGPTLPDEAFNFMLTDIAEKIRHQRVSPSSSAQFEFIKDSLENFHAGLNDHLRLETEVLLPRAAWIERELRGERAGI